MKLRAQSFSALFPLAILTLLAGLTFWLQRAVELGDLRKNGNIRHDPDYYAEKFSVQRFGPDGKLLSTMSAQKMLHYPDDDTTDATEPRVVHFGGDRVVRISAKQALVAPDAREIGLVGDVHVRREGLGKDPATELVTTTLTILPDDETARTIAPVTITQGQSIMRGTGLEADNKTAIYKLLSRVTGTIVKHP